MNTIMEKFFFAPISVDFGMSFQLSASQNAVYADYAPKMGARNLLYFTGMLDSFICW